MPAFTLPVGNKPPPGFTPLDKIHDVPDQKPLDIFGIVVDFRSPTFTRYEAKMTLTITSPELKSGSEDISFFDKAQENLPSSVKIGDVVMIRRAKRTGMGFTSVKTQFMSIVTIFDNTNIPDEAFMDAILAKNSTIPSRVHPESKRVIAPPSPEEQYYAMQLKSWAHRSKIVGMQGASNVTSTVVERSSENKRALVKLSSLKSGHFYDVIVEVVKVWVELYTVTLYVTDYTENPHFYDSRPQQHSDQPEWLSKTKSLFIAGKLSLQVTLFPPNAEWASDHEHELAGHLVFMRNLNIQSNRLDAPGGAIEGKLHGDRQRPNQIDIQMLTDKDPRAKELLERKERYHAATKSKGLRDVDDGDTSTKLTKNQKRKLSRRQKQKEKDEREALEKKELQRQVAPKPNVFEASRGPNPNVVTTHASKPCQSLHSITNSSLLHGKTESGGHITYPFVNVMFRARVRVVDFMPERLADFAQSLDDARYNDTADPSDGELSPISATPGASWEWAFSLLLQCDVGTNKVPEHLVVMVQGRDAEYLLNIDPCDLRRNPEVLQKLRDRLFILWGELEEVKKRGKENNIWPHQAKSRPFECCIQEYGVQDDANEWIRMHRITGTRIRED